MPLKDPKGQKSDYIYKANLCLAFTLNVNGLNKKFVCVYGSGGVKVFFKGIVKNC